MIEETLAAAETFLAEQPEETLPRGAVMRETYLHLRDISAAARLLQEENARLRGIFGDLRNDSLVAETAYQLGKDEGAAKATDAERHRVLSLLDQSVASWRSAVETEPSETISLVVAMLQVFRVAVAVPRCGGIDNPHPDAVLRMRGLQVPDASEYLAAGDDGSLDGRPDVDYLLLAERPRHARALNPGDIVQFLVAEASPNLEVGMLVRQVPFDDGRVRLLPCSRDDHPRYAIMAIEPSDPLNTRITARVL